MQCFQSQSTERQRQIGGRRGVLQGVGEADWQSERERETNVEKYTTSAINAAAVTFFSPLFFSPSSLAALPLLRTTPPHRRPARPLFNKFNYLPFDGSGNPSNVHEICGVGLPAAEHFKLTAGPGCSVCSMKLYSSTGGASVGEDI